MKLPEHMQLIQTCKILSQKDRSILKVLLASYNLAGSLEHSLEDLIYGITTIHVLKTLNALISHNTHLK